MAPGPTERGKATTDYIFIAQTPHNDAGSLSPIPSLEAIGSSGLLYTEPRIQFASTPGLTKKLKPNTGAVNFGAPTRGNLQVG